MLRWPWQEHRVRYNQANYVKVFGNDPAALEVIERSEAEPSLCDLVQKWLERTPGLDDSFNFWARYQKAVNRLLDQVKTESENTTDPVLAQHLLNQYEKKREMFQSIFDPDIHNALVARGERRFTHKALQVRF